MEIINRVKFYRNRFGICDCVGSNFVHSHRDSDVAVNRGPDYRSACDDVIVTLSRC